MASNPKKKAPRKKPQRARTGGVRAVRVRIKKAEKISSRDVELAIQKQLASTKTDVFRNDDTLVIVLEQHGNKGPIGE
jgi:hypothetical protein